MQKSTFGRLNWTILLIFGLIGQLAWSVENMYFNMFVFEEVSPNLEAITLMVQLSGITATVVTLIAGTFSDKLGNRRSFISWGYAIWGVTVALFGFLSPDRVSALFNVPATKAVAVTLVLVIIADCIMTVFGSTANDASFNAWVTDNTKPSYRGQVEGVLSILPLIAMLIVAGGFGILVSMIGYSTLFLLLGIFISACGIAGIFFIKDNPSLEKCGTFGDLFYGFKPSVIKANKPFYLTLLVIGVYGIACQIFMPYLIIYMKTYLGFTVVEYSVVFGLAIILGAALNLYLTKLSDKMDKTKMLYLAAAIFAVGLFGMWLANKGNHVMLLVVFGFFGFVMISGNILISALCGSTLRDYTPEGVVGKLQGVRMVFSVLLPMVFGPMIGNAINKARNLPLPDLESSADAMTTKYIPAPEIFLVAGLVCLLIFALIPILSSKIKNSGNTERVTNSLKTNYEVGEIPHDEYPRPQCKRDSYLCLNGKWSFAKVKQGEQVTDFNEEILVPFSPESLNSGIGKGFELHADEKLVYQRTFTIRKEFLKAKTLLHFGAVDQRCEVYVNGVQVGGHHGGYTPFTLDVSNAIKIGENLLRVECTDELDKYESVRGKQSANPKEIWYTAQSGIWQTVWMESVPEEYVRDLRIFTSVKDKRVTVLSDCEGAQTIRVFDGEKEIANESFDNKTISITADFELWSPENPKLYTFVLQTESGDKVESYFGVRSFGMGKDENGIPRLFLNEKPYFYNGLLDQGYWSDGLLTHPSDKAIEDELKLLKDMGFNMIRKHIKIEPLRWYYHCDRLGLIVWQDFVNGGGAYKFTHIAAFPFLGFHHKDNDYKYFARENEAGRYEFLQSVDETLNALKNCTCIGCWVPFNEGWGQFDSFAVTEKVLAFDDSRIIDSVSGWHDQGEDKTLLKSLHTYYTPLKVPKDSRPVVLSEFGGYSLKTENHVYSEKEFGYKVFKNQGEFCDALEKLYLEKLKPLIAKGLCACVYTQVSDVEEEINGLVTYDRKVIKMPVERMKSINEQLYKEMEKVK
ncbi:MAG: MFS transporter [Clostridia bacterium]|nr:MFS transporter [Clostridia bacterium]